MPYEPLCVLSMWDLTLQVGNKVIDYGLVLKTTMEIDFKKEVYLHPKGPKQLPALFLLIKLLLSLGLNATISIYKESVMCP
jgi:hypothetical protein